MSISKNISELTNKVDQLLAMVEECERQGDINARLFAEGLRHRLAELRRTSPSDQNMYLVQCLLDIVPTAKDLDAIDFRLDRYPRITELRNEIQTEGARIASPMIDALGD